MQANETLLEFWIGALCAEMEELSGAPISASTAPYEINRQGAYETVLLAQGPVAGELHITVEAGALVQFTQLSSGEPLDPEVACNPDRIEIWRRLLDATAGRLSTKLTADFTDAENNPCVVLLADTHPLSETDDPLAGEPGSRIERWLLQAGQSKIAVLARARAEFSENTVAAPAASADAIEADPSVETASPEESRDAATGNLPDGNASTVPDDAAGPQVPSMEAELEPEEVDRAGTRGPRNRRGDWDFDESETSPAKAGRYDLMLDIELEATLRFGAIEMPLREVLQLGPGDVLSLDRHVQEPVELVVGDRIVARGEVVLIGGNFGLQVTEVAEPRRRLETIRCLF